MADKTALQDQRKITTAQDEGTPQAHQGNTENGAGEGRPDPRQISFDARFAALTDGFGQACEQEGVEIAVAIAIHPKEKHPIVFVRGHQYDVTVLLTTVQRHFTRDLMAPLNPSPDYEPDGDDEE